MTLYLGPYIEAEFRRVLGTEKRHGCTNAACEMHGKQRDQYGSLTSKPSKSGKLKFCATCGERLADLESPVQREEPNRADAQEEIRERLTCPFGEYIGNRHVWLSNINNALKRSPWSWEWNDDLMQEITPNLIADEMKEFERFYAKELSCLCQIYKPNRPRLTWGLIDAGD